MRKTKPEWRYEDYSPWAQQIAMNYTRAEIGHEIAKCEGARAPLRKAHLSAVQKTTSMLGNSQRRAQSRNSLVGNYERLNAYRRALGIYENYPDKTKEGVPFSFGEKKY